VVRDARPRPGAARLHAADVGVDPDRGNEPCANTPIDGLARVAVSGGSFLGKPFAPKDGGNEKMERKEPRFSASLDGFDVHCAVRIAAEDDEGRERLLRSCARAPFALDRIEELSDGRIAYAMKTPRRGSTHRVMTPVEFLGRLAILVPPPYFPLVRYHGVFGARSSWRALVTPKPPDGVARRKKSKRCPSDTPSPSAPAPRASSTNAAPPAPTSEPASPVTAPSTARAIPLPRALEDPTTLTLKHWGRILEGELFATSSRVDWAVLLQRIFGFDALRCTTGERQYAHRRDHQRPRRREEDPRARRREHRAAASSASPRPDRADGLQRLRRLATRRALGHEDADGGRVPMSVLRPRPGADASRPARH
jgi:hypothetical protein